MRRIDLRSDTFTLPSKEMLESIPSAELGDDVEGEYPPLSQPHFLASDMFRTHPALLDLSVTLSRLCSLMPH